MPTKMTLKFSALSLEVVSDDTEFSLLIQGVGVVSGAARGVFWSEDNRGFLELLRWSDVRLFFASQLQVETTFDQSRADTNSDNPYHDELKTS